MSETGIATESEPFVSNVPAKVLELTDRNLHLQPNHPLCILKDLIYSYFGESYQKFDNQNKVVDIAENFDKLLIPADHPCRSRSDTYYVSPTQVYRTQTSAHQNELLGQGFERFLVSGDVYRKDEIDRSHFPVFHQMEGVCLMPEVDLESQEDPQDPKESLIKVLTGLVEHLFPGCEYRFNDDYFPFTYPSFEVEVKYQGEWLEILGCGVIQPEILKNCGFSPSRTGWAFGLGLERLAMRLFDIPDIRYFWTTDPKFLDQFRNNNVEIVQFQEYSRLDPITKDISFWIPGDQIVIPDQGEFKGQSVWAYQNDFYDLIRDTCGELIESMELFDTFMKKGQISHAYHIVYSPSDSRMKDPAEFTRMINHLHRTIGEQVPRLGVTLR